MFLREPAESEGRDATYASDVAADGYVWNFTRLWAWRPELLERFVELRTGLMDASGLGERDWAVLVTSTASELRDSYCSLAWGQKLAGLVDPETAGQVLAGADAPGLSDRDAALREWARQVVRDPNGTTAADVGRLRSAGLDDREIFDATAFVALRLAFSTINDALGAAPDLQLAEAAPDAVRGAVDYGRSVAAEPSSA